MQCCDKIEICMMITLSCYSCHHETVTFQHLTTGGWKVKSPAFTGFWDLFSILLFSFFNGTWFYNIYKSCYMIDFNGTDFITVSLFLILSIFHEWRVYNMDQLLMISLFQHPKIWEPGHRWSWNCYLRCSRLQSWLWWTENIVQQSWEPDW